MRIYYVCRRVPFPPDRGDKIATFNEIRHLSARHEVHVSFVFFPHSAS
jgi:polysaccharide biosynthesis protein PslH